MIKWVILSFSLAFAANQETYKDIISKAKNLSLQKDRLQATKILIRAAQKEKGLARKELIQNLQELSEVFYTEKGQQLFELGQSLKYSAPATSVERFQEALQLEPSNVEILKALTRILLSQGVCDRAQELTTQLVDANPFEDEHILLKLQTVNCLNLKDQVKTIVESAEQRRPETKIHFDLVKSQYLLQEGKFASADVILEKVMASDKKFPEAYYWMAQSKKIQKKDFTEPARNYLALCKSVGIEVRNKYRLEPRLCAEDKRIESDLEELKSKAAVAE